MTEWITAANQELWQNYGEKSTESWQFTARIFWEQEWARPDNIWHQWREHHRQNYPEPDFEHTWLRFSHKVEAQIRSLERPKSRWVVWLDLDVLQCQAVPDSVWPCLRPRPGDFLSYLGRGDGYHPETGWICYDTEHEDLDRFLVHLRGEYLGDRLFKLPQWHDAYVWDHVCRREGIRRTDLGPGTPGEAFGRSPLKDYFLHLKGPRKQNILTGKTEKELMRKPPIM